MAISLCAFWLRFIVQAAGSFGGQVDIRYGPGAIPDSIVKAHEVEHLKGGVGVAVGHEEADLLEVGPQLREPLLELLVGRVVAGDGTFLAFLGKMVRIFTRHGQVAA
ncbi:hypothetical protein A2389_01985 [Candidatus Adlerbacteria bacterium RIFOXYB1_FULL_48_10]|nr:MAG: hypothetical protein A2389_01985 [Candidatus Adlerbacteria bacterium RIFOXYB1_FULL_48_10]